MHNWSNRQGDRLRDRLTLHLYSVAEHAATVAIAGYGRVRVVS